MVKIEDKIDWCLKKGKVGKKHKGLKEINPNTEESENHVRKALSDLDAMDYLHKGKKTDWVASTAFYAMYHSLLAILYRIGYESRNQECTITLIEKLIKEKEINLESKYIDMIRNLKIDSEDAKSIREEMQYGSETFMIDDRCKKLMSNAKDFVERVREIIEELENRGEKDK